MTLPPRALATYLAARVLPALAGMGLTFVCIHALAPEQYAVYSLTLLAAGVAAGFVGGISGQALLRYSHELSPAALQRALLAFPLLAAAVVCPIVLAYLAWRGIANSTALLAAAAIPLLALVDTRRSLFIARGAARAVFALDACRSGLGLLLAFALLQGWSAQAAAPLLAQWLALAACLYLVRVPRAADSADGQRSIDAQYLGYGLGLAGWLAVVVGMSLAERAVVADTLGMAASGRYAAQADVINAVFSAAAGALGAAMMPAYLGQSANPDAAALRRLRRLGVVGVLAVAGVCVLLGALLSAASFGRISRALAGDVPTGLLLIAGGAVWATAGFVQKPLELRGQTYRLFAGVVVALLLFLWLGPVLAVHAGATGVALAKLVAGCAYVAFAVVAAQAPR